MGTQKKRNEGLPLVWVRFRTRRQEDSVLPRLIGSGIWITKNMQVCGQYGSGSKNTFWGWTPFVRCRPLERFWDVHRPGGLGIGDLSEAGRSLLSKLGRLKSS